MKLNKTLKIAGLIIFAIVTISLIGLYQKKSNADLNRYVEQEVARKSRLSKFFKSEKFTYKSSGAKGIKIQCYGGRHSDGSTCGYKNGKGKHTFGTIEKAALLPSSHVFDFVDMTVTLVAFFDSESQKTTYVINDYSKRVTPYSTIHILKIGTDGLEEIRINPNAATITYYYENGKILRFKNLTREVSFDLLGPKFKG